MSENPQASPDVAAPPASERPRLSVTVICMNEERNIRECLESVKWADEIVVVDSGSTDRTTEIAREFTPRVVHHEWPGYVAQKNYALGLARGEWVLCLDADERCTPELRDLLLRRLQNPGDVDGFKVRRHVFYLGRWIDHGGWYPDWKLRIVRRAKARWGGVDPHDKLEVEGRVEKLEADLLHYTYRDFSHQIRIIDRFSDVVRDGWLRAGRRPSLVLTVVHPLFKFLECYVWKLGFLDGFPGLAIAAASAFYVFAKRVKLWEAVRVK
jgi:glycosyltransferase involved in cell wall biosynthesis